MSHSYRDISVVWILESKVWRRKKVLKSVREKQDSHWTTEASYIY